MVKIVVDSGSDLTKSMKNKEDINVEQVALHLQVGNKHFVDDYDLDADMFINEMEASSSVVRTAAPSPESYMEKYKGNESIFAVTLSAKLSGSYNSALLAKKMYLSDIGEKFIHVFDSMTASIGETLIVLKINELAKAHMPDIQIVEGVNRFISDMHTFVALERFDNLVKNGRINPYIAKIASLLSIMPICKAQDGEIVLLEKTRGFKKMAAKLVDMIENSGADFENRVLGISHVKCLEKALIIKEAIVSRIKFKDVIVVESSPLCITYAQRNGVVICF